MNPGDKLAMIIAICFLAAIALVAIMGSPV